MSIILSFIPIDAHTHLWSSESFLLFLLFLWLFPGKLLYKITKTRHLKLTTWARKWVTVDNFFTGSWAHLSAISRWWIVTCSFSLFSSRSTSHSTGSNIHPATPLTISGNWINVLSAIISVYRLKCCLNLSESSWKVY